MNDEIRKTIEECSKDHESFEKLKSLFEEQQKRASQYMNWLELLERAIRNDYESIVITELNLEEPGPKIVYANDGFTRMTGYSREEAIGKTPRILQGEKTDQEVLRTLKEKLINGQPFFGHTVNYRKDGTEFVNQWDIHPLTDKDGNVTHWVSYQHDITERKITEKKLYDAEVEFDDLHEEAKSTILDLDVEGNILTGNRSFLDLTGYDLDELQEIKFWELLTGAARESIRKKFESFKPSDFEGRDFEITLVKSDGGKIEMIAKARLLGDNGRKVIRMKLSNRSLEKRIVKMLQKQSAYDRILDNSTDFGYKVSVNNSGELIYSSISNSFCNIIGLHKNDIEGEPVRDRILEEDWPKVKKHLEKVLKGKPNTEEYEMVTRDGASISVIDSAKPHPDEDNPKYAKGSVSLKILAG